jgi:hypothetical protein
VASLSGGFFTWGGALGASREGLRLVAVAQPYFFLKGGDADVVVRD